MRALAIHHQEGDPGDVDQAADLPDDLLQRPAQPGLGPGGVLDAALGLHRVTLSAPW